MDIGISRKEMVRRLTAVLDANGMDGDGVHIRLMVTRGVRSTPYQDPRVVVSPATIVIIPEWKAPVPETATRLLSLFTVVDFAPFLNDTNSVESLGRPIGEVAFFLTRRKKRMKFKHYMLAAAALAAPLAFAPAAPQSVSAVNFSRGATSTTINGSIRGYQYIDYRVVVRAGQMLRVNLTRLRGSPYFNVLEPGQRDVAIFVGSTSGSDFEARTSQNGAYTIRVYQMRSSARRNETASYRLTIAAAAATGRPIIEGAGRPSHPMAPAHHPGDALVRGTPYHAVAPVRCRTVMGGAFGTCKAGVIRRPNSATIHLDTPDGGERTINFREGRAVSSDSENPIRVDRRGDTSIIRIGAVEIYEIPDALPFGG